MKIDSDRFITAIFCDDIRHELGDKLSYMGCYQGELNVQVAPVMLPKLCIFASIFTPKERPFKSIVLRIVQDNDIELAHMDIPGEGIVGINQISDETSTRKSLSTAIVFSPFMIEKSTILRLMATTEEGEITGPCLLIKVAAIQEIGIQDTSTQPAKKTKAVKPKAIKKTL